MKALLLGVCLSAAAPLWGQSVAPASDQEELLAWIHDGCAVERPAEDEDGRATLAWWLAQLVPSTHAAPVPAELQAQAVLQVLKAWQADVIPLDWQDAAFARLRGHIDRAAAVVIAEMLQDETAPRPVDLIHLWLEAEDPAAREVWLDFVLDPSHPAEARGQVAETLVLLEGRSAMEALLPTVHAQAEGPYLRRLFAAWRTCLVREDLALLEEIAHQAEGFVAEFALQLWAIHETEPEARLRIYRRARQRDDSYRATALMALARGGPDEAITAGLLADLENSGREMRRLSRRLIPLFSDEATLLDAYRERASGMSATLRGQWVLDLAGLQDPQGTQLAIEWLLEGGWRSRTVARQVLRQLGRTPTVDSTLPELLRIEGLDPELAFQIAMDRSHTSADARLFLQDHIQQLLPSRQMGVLDASVVSGSLEDQLFVVDFIANEANPARSRAGAVRALSMLPQAADLLQEWRQPLPQDYELLEAVMEVHLRSARPEDRAWAEQLLREPPAFLEEDESRGLRILAWETIARRGQPGDPERLTMALVELLPQLEVEESSSWSLLFRFDRELPELTALLEAIRFHCRTFPGRPLPWPADFDLSGLPADLLLVAATRLADADPSVSLAFFSELQRRGLPEEKQLRLDGLTARFLSSGSLPLAAWQRLLQRPDLLRQYPKPLRESFAPAGIGWVLLHDRLAERYLVQQVADGSRELVELEPLLEGWVEDEVLESAAELAWASGTHVGKKLSARLQARRAVHLPLNRDVRARLIELALELEEAELAQAHEGVLRRLSPRDLRPRR